MDSFSSRTRVDQRLLSSLPQRLNQRDVMILRLLYEHRVLTTHQITDVGFDATRRAERRLLKLFAYRVVDRFRPMLKVGTAPFHWVLDHGGAHVIAAERDTTIRQLGWDRAQALGLAHNERLPHLVGTNGFFTGLMRAARHREGCDLAAWWSERQCASQWGRVVRPDGYGIWVEDGVRLPFLLEYDRGYETLERLAEKLPGYATLAEAAGHPTVVLFAFPGPKREAHARRVLAHGTVPVATASPIIGECPSGPIWRLVGGDSATVRLIDLAPHLAGWRNAASTDLHRSRV